MLDEEGYDPADARAGLNVVLLKMVKAKLNDTRYYPPETIDTKPQATVLSLGAVKFNPIN